MRGAFFPAPCGFRILLAGAAVLATSWLLGCDIPAVVGVQEGGDPFLPVRLARNDSVDVLFVVDDSPSMAAKQSLLRAALPKFVAALPTATSYHFAAITSDLGAGSITTQGTTMNCRIGGDGAAPAAVGRAADRASCPGSADGRPFLDEDLIHARTNRSAGQSLAAALDCMLDAGHSGCFVQQPLAAALTALAVSAAKPDAERFLRPDALLVIVFLTDGDDCSLPSNSDLFDANRENDYGPLTAFRCARFGIEYGLSPRQIPAVPTGGPLAMPAPAPFGASDIPGKLIDASQFRDAFALPASSGGIKADPNDVVLMAIAAPPEPFEIIGVVAGTEKTEMPAGCAPLDGDKCVSALRHACAAASQPSLFGDPAVRLRAVVSSVKHGYASPVCGVDQAPALADLARSIQSQQMGAGCLSARLVDPANPDCVVSDQIKEPDGSTRTQSIPMCMAGSSNVETPCWRLLPDAHCAPVGGAGDRQEYRIDIDRGGKGAPASSTALARCASPRN